ncbi:MAG: hypothetical protein HY367_01375, partial [Candidatus Aenigmarchaeota archaeon]|nr:hypothetical protein [Candidatus Aenigmarchaeota archaeon]
MTLRIQVEPGAGMNDEEYMAWNIEGATRRLRDAPEEAEITLVVYEIHRAMMAKRGVSEY